jgi:hypothetical protein
MAYASGFEYDLFISYARTDDSEKTTSGNGWVSEFVLRLQGTLRSRLGGSEQLRIFFDQSSLTANSQLPQLLQAAASSATFLAIASPAYAERDWTKKELAAFTGANELPGLFAAEFLPLDGGKDYPAPLDSHKRAKFWAVDEPHSSTPMPMMPDESGPYRGRIHDLAAQIRSRLVAINTGKMIEGIASQVADDAARRKKGVVLLAQTTDELEDDRLQVQRYLEQYGYFVLPRTDYPQGGEPFRTAVAEDVGQAKLFVQLLGPRPGKRPPDLPEGYPRSQFEAAKRAAVPVMLWRRPDLDLATVGDADQLQLLNDASVIASGLESFKADIRRRLETPPETRGKALNDTGEAGPDGGRPPVSVVFINADENDYDVAKTVRKEFEARNLTTVIPMHNPTAAGFHKDLKERLTDCDVLVFLYGRAPESWIRQQLMFFNKLRPGAKARVVAVLVGPPEGKPEDPGVSIPELKRVVSFDQWRVAPILELIDGLGENA